MNAAQIARVLADVSGIPGLGQAVSLVQQIWDNCEAVKVQQDGCRRLRDRCVRIIVNLREGSRGAEGTFIMKAVDQATAVLERIAKKTQEWTTKKFIDRFIRTDKVSQDLVVFNSELDTCMDMFQNTGLMALNQNDAVLTALLMQLLDMSNTQGALLRQIELNQMPHSQTMSLMDTVQQNMRRMSIDSPVHTRLGQGLYSLSKASGELPPLVNLQGEIKKLRPEPVSGGTSSDVWLGVWLGKATVAVKGLREHKTNPQRVERFTKEAVLWRNLKHDNILPCFGIASDQCPSIALISPWMEHRDALTYINTFPDCDRRRILRGTARGLEYLHRRNVVHGDLRAHKILIDANGDAKICDFGLAAVITEGAGSTSTAATTARWIAPELMNGQAQPSQASDVFSYGRTVLEIMTGLKPFSNIRNAFQIVTDVCNGVEPQRPQDDEVIQRGLTDEVWHFIRRCWQFEPHLRPTMAEVLDETEYLLWD